MTEIDIQPGLIQRLQTARHIGVLTGAGVSAESGIPTFREAQTGLWARYNPEELASADAFRKNPKLVWEWYEWRRSLVRDALPNASHYTLAALENRVDRMTLITQNVDGLHQRAGHRVVIELHGNLTRNRCFREDVVVEAEMGDTQIPPTCPRCGAPLRPDVVWFGESLPVEALRAAALAAATSDLFLSIGTSALVHPAASLPLEALRRGIPTVEINLARTPLTPYVDYALSGAAGVVLPALLKAAWPA